MSSVCGKSRSSFTTCTWDSSENQNYKFLELQIFPIWKWCYGHTKLIVCSGFLVGQMMGRAAGSFFFFVTAHGWWSRSQSQFFFFLAVCVSLGELGSPETLENSMKRLCGSSNEKQGEKLPLSCRHWVPLVRLLSGLAKDLHVGKIQLKQVNHKLRRCAIHMAISPGLQRPCEKFGTARLCRKKRKKANFVYIVESFC